MPTVDHNVSFPDFEGIKAHVRRNKERYIGMGIGISIAGITCVIMRGSDAGIHRVPEAIAIRPLSIFSRQNVVTVIERDGRGHPGYLVQCVETGQIFPSQDAAARSVGAYPSILSSHLQGKHPDVYGFHFKRMVA